MSQGLLLDTHVLLWWFHQPLALSRRARGAIEETGTAIFVSPVSAIEVAIKRRKRKLGFETPWLDNFPVEMEREGFKELAISSEHARVAGGFSSPHDDPWDRLLAAQALIAGLVLMTKDREMQTFGVNTFW